MAPRLSFQRSRIALAPAQGDDGAAGQRVEDGVAAEVHAQIAVSVFVRTLTEAVRRKGTQRYDQRDGRDKRDQTNTEETPAQGGSYLSRDE